MTARARIRLRLIGRLTLGFDDSPPIRLSTRKSGALVAFLATRPEQTASREQLATLLWGSCADAQARQSLRQALVLLRKELGDADLIAADKSAVRLAPDAWSVDLHEFEALARSVDPDALVRAGELFSGAFLQDFNIEEEAFGEWLREQRQRVERTAARLCETYAARPELVRDGQHAIAAAERLVALDPLREDWQRLVLTLCARYRGRAEALARADGFAALLRRELDVAPEPETRALVDDIRAGVITPAKTAPELRPAPVEVAAAAAEHSGRPLLPTPRFAAARAVGAGLAAGALLAIAAVAGVTLHGAAPARPADRAAPAAAISAAAPPERTASESDPTDPKLSSGVAAILVLPFTVAGEASERSAALAARMSDDLPNVLSRVGGFRVISRQTALSFRNGQVDAAEVGAKLGVRYLLQGSIEARDERLFAALELTEAKTNRRVWSARFDRAGNDLPVLTDEILKSLGRELQVEITQAEARRDSSPNDLHALIYKGWAAIAESRRIGAPALEQAQRHFAQVLAQEPGNTRAMTGLGASHVLIALQPYTPDPNAHLAQAEILLKQVIERRPDVGGPSLYLGMASNARGETDAAIKWFEREIERNPTQAAAYAHLGRALAGTGRAEEGLERILYAMRLSPHDPGFPVWLEFAGLAELELKHPDRAIEYLERAVDQSPAESRPRLALAAAHALAGHDDAAQELLRAAQKAAPMVPRERLIARSFGRGSQTKWPQLHEGLNRVLARSADPWQSPGASSQQGSASIIPILVLPFMTSGEPSGDIRLMADMVTDDLTNLLSRSPSFRVISRQTARRFAEQPIDVAAIGVELQVRYVLEGTMRLQDGRLRVNVELIDPATRLAVWVGRIEREDASRRGVQDEIVARLAREMQFEILPIESARRANDSDSEALAYRGWAALSEPSHDGYERARTLFEQSLARDPDNLSATIGLGAYHARMGAQVYDTDALGHRTRAAQILREAIRRAPQSSDAQFYLGLALNLPPTLPQAVQHFARAIELDPSNASAHGQIGNALIRTGRAAEGLEHVRYAMRLSPRDPIMPIWLEFAGNAELELRNYPAAIGLFRRSTELNPGYPRSWAGLAAAYALAGNAEDAQRYAEKLKSFAPELNADGLVKHYGRQNSSRLHEGLRLAFLAHPG